MAGSNNLKLVAGVDVAKAIVWNPATGAFEGEPTRCADLYVFCHYPERDKAKANVFDVPSWGFCVAS